MPRVLRKNAKLAIAELLVICFKFIVLIQDNRIGNIYLSLQEKK